MDCGGGDSVGGVVWTVVWGDSEGQCVRTVVWE